VGVPDCYPYLRKKMGHLSGMHHDFMVVREGLEPSNGQYEAGSY
jgi:hypothetical protein